MEYVVFASYAYFIITFIIIVIYIMIPLRGKIRNKKNQIKQGFYEKKIKEEISQFESGNLISDVHTLFLKEKLVHIKNLLIFEEVLLSLQKENRDAIEQYCRRNACAFSTLIQHYRKKSSIQKAYFTHVLSVFPYLMHDNDNMVDYAMMHFVFDSSIYCRENAMLFFYHKGIEQEVVNSLKKIDKRNLYYNAKMLADDLLQFNGSHTQLSSLLLEEFNEFSVGFQSAIIQYIRFVGVDKKESLYQMLLSGKYDKEVDLAMIRYFARFKFNPVLKQLLKFMEDKNSYSCEYRIVTAFALATYDKKEVRKILIESLKDHNWYVRRNAAVSLSKMELSVKELQDAMKVNDPYAQEMLQILWQEKIWKEDHLPKKKKGLDKVCSS